MILLELVLQLRIVLDLLNRSLLLLYFLGFAALGALVKQYTDALNDPNAIPNVEAAWDTYVKEKCSEVKTRALQIYDQNMTRQMKSIFPCEDEEILKHHERFQERSMQLYADETAEFISICTGKESRELSVGKLMVHHSCILQI